MTKRQGHLVHEIESHCREAAYHIHAAAVQSELKCGCCALITLHNQQVAKARKTVGGLLIELMNSGISHRCFYRIVRKLERTA